MRAHFYKIHLSKDQSFQVGYDLGPYFYNQWHYHPEIELLYIIQGRGTVFIGDAIRPFREDDILLIGPNVPHLTKSDPEYYEGNTELKSEALVLHFRQEVFKQFLDLPENQDIVTLLDQAMHGVMVKAGKEEKLRDLIIGIRNEEKSARLISLLYILHLMAGSAGLQVLSHRRFGKAFHVHDEQRMNRIYHYTLNNFNKRIKLEEIAAIIHMTPHSFCRYFKSRTKKRYSEFLLEVKVSYACKLLSETGFSAGIICYESGFTNLSNFNRHFKEITGKTPSEYRKGLRQRRLSPPL